MPDQQRADAGVKLLQHVDYSVYWNDVKQHLEEQEYRGAVLPLLVDVLVPDSEQFLSADTTYKGDQASNTKYHSVEARYRDDAGGNDGLSPQY